MAGENSPRLQVALDFVSLRRAVRVAAAAVEGGADLLEVGTPLLKAEGLEAVRALKREFPNVPVVADLKTMDAGRMEMEAAAKAGASIGTVLGAASAATIRECVEAGRNYGIEVQVDLLGAPDAVAAAKKAEELGAAIVGVHTPIDEQMEGRDPFDLLRRVRQEVALPLAVAGGVNSETAAEAIKAGANVVIVGGAITKAEDPLAATKEIKRALLTGERIPTTLFKRVVDGQVADVLRLVSTANISDGDHRRAPLAGLRPLFPGIKMVGPAFTVRTYPGDWAKTVEAIDLAETGSVIVIDAGGLPPAVWGELATRSALQRGIAGVVVDGAVRDTADIIRLKFPVFTRAVTCQAGEPKGLAEVDVPVNLGGVRVFPRDLIVGDDDGVIAIPRERKAEVANRALSCLEYENRIRAEIEEGKTTLGQVTELLKWEKRV